MTRLKGALAVLAIAALVAGFPAAMLALGLTPVPAGPLPPAGDMLGALTRPDDGTLLVGVLVLLGWLAWAAWTVSLALEVWARLRGAPAPRIRGLGWSQTMAAGLVTAALLLTTAPAGVALAGTTAAAAPRVPAAVTAGADPATPPGPGPTPTPATTTAPTAEPAPAPVPTPAPTYLVRDGDTLWDIAAATLGAAQRWPQIAALNTGRVQPDGRTLGPDGWVYPGWTLLLPPTTPPPGTLVVQAGDTLSGLAAEHLGDPDRWQEIYTASRDLPQPGGTHLADPDLIHPGWTLRLPTPAAGDTTDTSRPAPPTAADSGATPPAPTPAAAAAPAPDLPPPQAVPPAGTGPAPRGDTADTPRSAPPTATDTDPAGEADPQAVPGWVVTGLAGGGALLAGALWLELRRRRRTQFRHRRPGRALTAPAPSLAPVEKTLAAVGTRTVPALHALDAALRRLAHDQAAADQPMPDLVAVHLAGEQIRLHLADPADLPHPWTADPTRRRWTLPTAHPTTAAGAGTPAPYPLLVTIGADEHGPWLLNLEDHVLAVTGDPTMGQDLVRYLAAELTVNPWSAEVLLDCAGIAAELAPVAPHRVRTVTDLAATATDAVADAAGLVDRAHADRLPNLPTARARQAGLDVWPARVLLVDTTRPGTDTGALTELAHLVGDPTGRTGCAVVLTAAEPDPDATELHLTPTGRLVLPAAGLDLEAVGLTPDEATGLALLLAAADGTDDTPMPAPATADGWQGLVDHAGALRPDLTEQRDPDQVQPTSLLPDPDPVYLTAAATTSDDLAVLAPATPPDVTDQVLAADPTLDADLHEWRHGGPRPKLRLLGPVQTRAAGQPPAKRRPYYTELLAFLHAHQHRGASTEDLAAYFAPSRIPSDINILRLWLGKNPATNRPWLPDARATGGVYRAELLADIDLFHRLRARAQARGADGLPDLVDALRLVDGQPFDRLRPGGWAWLFDGERLDEYAVCAILDVAHLVVTASLAAGDTRTARLAAQIARTAAPYSESATADLAAVAAADGDTAEAHRLLAQVAGYAEDGEAPELPSPRGEQLLGQANWLEKAG